MLLLLHILRDIPFAARPCRSPTTCLSDLVGTSGPTQIGLPTRTPYYVSLHICEMLEYLEDVHFAVSLIYKSTLVRGPLKIITKLYRIPG